MNELEIIRQSVNSAIIASQRQLEAAEKDLLKLRREVMSQKELITKLTVENDELVTLLNTERRDSLAAVELKVLRGLKIALGKAKDLRLPAKTRARRAQKTGAAERSCSVDWCQNPGKRTGLCNSHYLRKATNGDPLLIKRRVNGVFTLCREIAQGQYEPVAEPETPLYSTEVTNDDHD